MKIIYNENPLRSVVELDAPDREVFWLKIKVEELQNTLFSVHFDLSESEYFNVTAARALADPEKYIKEDDQEKTPLDERVDRMFEYYVKALSDTHVGDCTCTACSCLKCRSEKIAGVGTLTPYPGKHTLLYVDSAFGKNRALPEALEYLRTCKADPTKPDSWKHSTQEDYASHVTRWEKQAADAYEYLRQYANKHFPGT